MPPKLKVVGSIPRLDARFLPQHVDPPINWVVTWLWSVVKRLELSEIRRYISLQIIIIIINPMNLLLPPTKLLSQENIYLDRSDK